MIRARISEASKRKQLRPVVGPPITRTQNRKDGVAVFSQRVPFTNPAAMGIFPSGRRAMRSSFSRAPNNVFAVSSQQVVPILHGRRIY